MYERVRGNFCSLFFLERNFYQKYYILHKNIFIVEICEKNNCKIYANLIVNIVLFTENSKNRQNKYHIKVILFV